MTWKIPKMFETTNQIKVIHDEIFTVFQSARSLRVGCILSINDSVKSLVSACCAVGPMGRGVALVTSDGSKHGDQKLFPLSLLNQVWIPMVGAVKPINSLPRCFYKWGCGLQTYPWLYSSCCCWQLLSLNINPGLINPGWLIVVVPPNSDKWLLKWYPPNQTAAWGLLIQGCHYLSLFSLMKEHWQSAKRS